MAKRANGEGSIFFRKDNNRWAAQVCIGVKPNGQYRYKTFYTDTQAQAKEKLKEYERKTHMLNKPLQDMVFDKWFRRWLYDLREPELKRTSFDRYDGLYRNYISKSPFRSSILGDITNSEVQLWYKDLEKTISKAQLKMIHDLVKASFRQAIYDRVIMFNPTDGIKVVREQPIAEVLSAADQKILTDYLLDCDDSMRELLLICIATGMRRGELLALTWDDYDRERGVIRVNKSYQRAKINNKWVDNVTSPKTKNSVRDIPLPDMAIKVLDDLKDKPGDNPKNLILRTNKGEHVYIATPGKHLKEICKKLDIPNVTLHGLRHSYATRLFELEVPVKTVQMLMGHSRVETTLDIYTHVMPDIKADAVSALNSIF